MFWRVQLPLALPEIMLGINQTILLALSMLIITAMIGTRDLGQEVFIALAKADAGRGLIAGLTVAFIGITADRLIGAWSRRARQRLGPSRARPHDRRTRQAARARPAPRRVRADLPGDGGGPRSAAAAPVR